MMQTADVGQVLYGFFEANYISGKKRKSTGINIIKASIQLFLFPDASCQFKVD